MTERARAADAPQSGKENEPVMSRSKQRATSDDEEDPSVTELRRRLDSVGGCCKVCADGQITAERDRLRTQRDAITRQFEDLSKVRTTEQEKVYERYKEKANLKAKGG